MYLSSALAALLTSVRVIEIYGHFLSSYMFCFRIKSFYPSGLCLSFRLNFTVCGRYLEQFQISKAKRNEIMVVRRVLTTWCCSERLVHTLRHSWSKNQIYNFHYGHLQRRFSPSLWSINNPFSFQYLGQRKVKISGRPKRAKKITIPSGRRCNTEQHYFGRVPLTSRISHRLIMSYKVPMQKNYRK